MVKEKACIENKTRNVLSSNTRLGRSIQTYLNFETRFFNRYFYFYRLYVIIVTHT